MPRPVQKRTVKGIFKDPEKGRFGAKLDRTGKYYWFGDPNVAEINQVSYARRRLKGRKSEPEHLVEKRFFRSYSNPEKDYTALLELRNAGAHVVPGFQLVLTRNSKGKLERSLVMKDLTERGKKVVLSPLEIQTNPKFRKMFEGIKNRGELAKQINADVGIAASKGFGVWPDMFLYAIDKKSNTAQAFIVDVDHVRKESRFFEGKPRPVIDINLGGKSLREAYKTLDPIIRRSQRPSSFAAGTLASKSRKHQQLVLNFVKKEISSNPEFFSELQKVYSSVIGIASKHQIGGTVIQGTTKGLTKNQRKIIHQEISKSGKKDPIYSRYRDFKYLARNLFPESEREAKTIYSIKRKSKREQWDSTRIGQIASQMVAEASKKLGRPLFSFDPRLASKFEEVMKQVDSSKSRQEAEAILKANQDVLFNRMVQELKERFSKDLSEIANFRKRTDLLPYSVPEYKKTKKHKELVKTWEALRAK